MRTIFTRGKCKKNSTASMNKRLADSIARTDSLTGTIHLNNNDPLHLVYASNNNQDEWMEPIQEITRRHVILRWEHDGYGGSSVLRFNVNDTGNI
jgi:hypothetical protein